jgi:hypothetical protein
MLSVVMLNVIMLNVVMLNVVMLNVVTLNVVMLSVIMLIVVAPLGRLQPYSETLKLAGKSCQGQTLQLIKNIR